MIHRNIFFGCLLFCCLTIINNFLIFANFPFALVSTLLTAFLLLCWTMLLCVILRSVDPEKISHLFSQRTMLVAGAVGALFLAINWRSSMQAFFHPAFILLISLLQMVSASFGFGIGMVVALIFSPKK